MTTETTTPVSAFDSTLYEKMMRVEIRVIYDSEDPDNSVWDFYDNEGNPVSLIPVGKEYQTRKNRDLDDDQKFLVPGSSTNYQFTDPLYATPLGYFSEGHYSVTGGNTRLMLIEDRMQKNIDRYSVLVRSSASPEDFAAFDGGYKFEPFDVLIYKRETLEADPLMLLKLAYNNNTVSQLTSIDKAQAYANTYELVRADLAAKIHREPSPKTVHTKTSELLGIGKNSNAGYGFLKLASLLEDSSYNVWIEAIQQGFTSSYNVTEIVSSRLKAYNKANPDNPLSPIDAYNGIVENIEVENDLDDLNRTDAKQKIFKLKITRADIDQFFDAQMKLSEVSEESEAETSEDVSAVSTSRKSNEEKKAEKERIESLNPDELNDQLKSVIDSVGKEISKLPESEFLDHSLNALSNISSFWDNLTLPDQKKLYSQILSFEGRIKAVLTSIDDLASDKAAKIEGFYLKAQKAREEREKEKLQTEQVLASRSASDSETSESDF